MKYTKIKIDWREIMHKLLAVLFILLCSLGGCTYFNAKLGIENDGSVEEFFEILLEKEMGLPEGTIDFTPSSPEKK